MDVLRINSGAKRIQINDGPEYIEFNPADVGFAERFYKVYREFEMKQAEYAARAAEIDANESADDGEKIAFLAEVCRYMRDRIDYVFGAGVSQKAFGDALSLDMIGQFFDGMTPFVQTARSEKMAKYSRKKNGQVMQ